MRGPAVAPLAVALAVTAGLVPTSARAQAEGGDRNDFAWNRAEIDCRGRKTPLSFDRRTRRYAVPSGIADGCLLRIVWVLDPRDHGTEHGSRIMDRVMADRTGRAVTPSDPALEHLGGGSPKWHVQAEIPLTRVRLPEEIGMAVGMADGSRVVASPTFRRFVTDRSDAVARERTEGAGRAEGAAPRRLPRPRRQSYEIAGGEVVTLWLETTTQLFRFREVAETDGTRCRIQSTPRGVDLAGTGSYVGSALSDAEIRCVFHMFEGRNLADGWHLAEVELEARIGSFEFVRAPRRGTDDLSFVVRVEDDPIPITTLRKITLEGPAGRDWREAFRRR